MAGEPAFFELGVQDDDKGRAFYADLFGWDFRPGPNGGYEIATSGIPGGIHGGDKGAPEQQARTGRFKLCRDNQGSAFGLHRRP